MADPCNCPDQSILGCQCIEEATSTITPDGAGSVGDPRTHDVNFDPDARNQAFDSGTGLLVPTYPWCKVAAAADQNRTSGDTLRFEIDVFDDYGMHSTSDTGNANHHIFPLEDGWYIGHACCVVEDNADMTSVTLTIEDDGGNIIGQTNESRLAGKDRILRVNEEFPIEIASVTYVVVALAFTGFDPATVLGGGSYYHRTNFTLRKVHGL